MSDARPDQDDAQEARALEDVEANELARGVVRERAVWVEQAHGILLLRSHVVGFGMLSLSRRLTKPSSAGRRGKKGGRPTHGVMEVPENEHLQLTLEEAYYAAFEARLLYIFGIEDPAKAWLEEDCWAQFCSLDSNFPMAFAAYYKYRKAGWAPHSGLKYGADYVLYDHRHLMKTKAHHAHAPYCVRLVYRREDEADTTVLAESAPSLYGTLRVTHNVVKKLVLCLVVYPVSGGHLRSASDARSCISVRELMFRRFVPTKHLTPTWQELKKRQKIEERTIKKAQKYVPVAVFLKLQFVTERLCASTVGNNLKLQLAVLSQSFTEIPQKQPSMWKSLRTTQIHRLEAAD
ncbi:tRNA-splicing endonuclease subunit Sen2 [Porphyridium purpureum]|uniref:tRNA-intron lyase n=1 Tax=Porphyridium purpureum TaxID=35688 RepID=A0A5J4YWZ0_PORPP|nr:tRNA-splicing endonuclease subunit Sen2 [Porphyridium purpureum]|eukprot:POR4432..scf227_4